MKEKIIKTQKQLDALTRVDVDEYVVIESETELELKFNIEVYGFLKINCKMKFGSSSVEAWGSSRVVARESSRVVARESSRVEAWGSSSVEAWGSSRVVAWESSRVEAWESSSVEAWESSSVEAWGSSSVVARGSSRVEAWGSSSVEAWGSSRVVARESSRVVARGSSRVEAWGSSSVEAWGSSSVELWGFAVCFKNIDISAKVIKKSKTAYIQKIKKQTWFERNGIKKTQKIILFKRVSKDFKTQEGTLNETLWEIGTKVTHPNWKPKSGECGEGKFHACSRPYFCDEFRDNPEDKYIAVKVMLSDTYAWEDNPQYPYKIGFREGFVLYECDKFGDKIA